MPLIDHGGFAVAVELSEATATALARSAITIPAITGPFNTPQARGTFHSSVAVAGIDFNVGEAIGITIDLAGSTIDIDDITGFSGPIPGSFRTIALAGTVVVTDTVQVRGRSVVVDFTPSGTLPDVVVHLDEARLLAAPLIQLALANAYIQGGEQGYWTARNALLASMEQFVRNGVGLALLTRPVNVLFNAPSGFPVPGTPPVTIPVTRVAAKTLSQSLKVLLDLGGPPGNPAAITRSQLLVSTSTGVPVDAAALVVSNAGLLRDILRPIAVARLGLPPGGFLAGENFIFRGPAPLPTGGVPVTAVIDSLSVITDESSRLVVSGALTATAPAGAMSITASITQPFSLDVTVVGRTLTLTATPVGAPTVSSDVAIAAWVYAAAAFTGGAAVLALLATADAFAGALGLNGAISGFIARVLPASIGIPLPLPAGFPAVVRRAVSLNQPDAPRGTLPFGIPNPFRDHDLIANLV